MGILYQDSAQKQLIFKHLNIKKYSSMRHVLRRE